MQNVAEIFKAYDVRGVYPQELNPEIAYKIGRALVVYLKAKQVVVGRDMRVSSPALASAIIDGILDQGADVCDIGLVSTDSLYFAVGKSGYDAGVMVTASHNPPEYNGFKLCRQEARPLSMDQGIGEIRDLVLRNQFPDPPSPGTVHSKEILDDFADHVLSMIDTKSVRPLKVVVDAGNGMAGKVVPAVFGRLPLQVVPLYFELDGRFPNHLANPLEPENVVDLRRAVLEHKADLGIAFDGDADRMFILDEHGQFVGGDMITALVSKSLLRKHPGASIVYNLICSRAVPETIEREGGKAIRSRVGHSFIKAKMREHDAIFGGEHSGHFYFRDNWYADSGIIAALTVIELLSQEGVTMSEALKPLDQYYRSGEINSEVADQQAVLRRLESRFSDGQLDYLDGLTVNYPDWWFNVRPSNTQPLLRLNVEANDPALLEEKTQAVLSVIRQG
ncbi:phosphomannomutase/phosphoglucomutase [Sphaerobacter thermophilus]|uniref:Phosphomannomutase n=1 Tax=Sphaerobacter thermophilus (strain ATCC 49802 / DSM 20745 / KCCM 41009 / NCIMB 13125 / S 6022) TaxID=479434 RepID=D1C3H3_SPHTD|nr:phosphomannomutase/phosphoglucomutase [Sphaerobacter thermophilus]ACZ38790.1 Phosphomannomutase [Sphaerobacter thermophilus DSM 20745]